jgi:hypothetical protein
LHLMRVLEALRQGWISVEEAIATGVKGA